MSGFFAAMIVCVLTSLPILGAIIGIRAILKKPIKKLALAVAICAASIIPLTVLGVVTDPATWCNHQWGVVETVEATCKTKGYTTQQCELCDRTRQTDKTSALGHSMRETSRIEPTTSSVGNVVNKCERCGYEEVTTLSKLDPPGKNAPKKTDDGVLKYALSEDKSYYIVKDVVDSSVTEINIPNSLNGVPVKSIGKKAFKSCRKLVSISIPDTITNIEESAFESCTSLKSVVIPPTIDTINASTFEYCSSLESVTLPDNLKVIGSFAFLGCRKLSSITIPKSVTNIGGSAFSDCDNLKSVYITDLVSWCNISFGGYNSNPLEYALNFYINGEFVKELAIPEGVTSIGAYAFSGYTGLTGVTIPKTLKSIGQNAFQKCTSLKNVYISDLAAWCSVDINGYDATPLSDGGVLYLNGEAIKDLVIPNNVTSISRYAFYGFTTLNSVTFHNKVTDIGACAFAHCIALTNISFPDSVTSIGQNAFYNCYSLQDIEMGSGISQIGEFAFEKCNAIKSFTYNGKVEEWNLVQLHRLWEGYVHHCAIKCKDGVIATNGTVTYN